MIRFPHVTNIGIKMSGGADSSLVAYLIIDHIVREGLDIRVHPIIIVEEEAPFQEIFASTVIDFVERRHRFSFEQKIVRHHAINCDKIKTIRQVESELRGKLDLIVSGVTQLPNANDFDSPGGPDENRSGVFPTVWDEWIYTPFVNIDKKEIAKLYQQHGLIETLFPLTRSCVAATTDFSKHCGNCWWCKEREWAFGKL